MGLPLWHTRKTPRVIILSCQLPGLLLLCAALLPSNSDIGEGLRSIILAWYNSKIRVSSICQLPGLLLLLFVVSPQTYISECLLFSANYWIRYL